MRKVLLVILDGWGHSDFEGEPTEGNAVELANVPTFRRLYDSFPRTRLACSGGDVGLPEGQMGNSEVGHLNLGAGRVVYQDIARVDKAIADGEFGAALGLEDPRGRARVRRRGAQSPPPLHGAFRSAAGGRAGSGALHHRRARHVADGGHGVSGRDRRGVCA